MEMARSNRVSFILACQNLSGLNAVSGDTITDKLMALCGTLVFLTNNCPTTLRLAQRIFGTHLVMRAHRTTVPALAPPQLFLTDEPDEPEPAQVTQVPTEVPLISAETLSRLPAGAARAKLADGSVHEFQCTFD